MAYDFSLRTKIGDPAAERDGSRRRYERTYCGHALRDGRAPGAGSMASGTPLVQFKEPDGNRSFGITEELLSLGLLLPASPGGGKTNTLFFIVREVIRKLLETGKGKMVILDSKGDYYREFAPMLPKEACFVFGGGNDYKSITRFHNIFAEMMPRAMDGRLVYTGEECDEEALENSAFFFTNMKSDSQPIFPAMGQLVLETVLIWHMRKYWRTAPEKLNNQELRRFFSSTKEEITRIFHERGMEDYRGRLEFFERNSHQSQGVLSYVLTVLSEFLVGPFGKADIGRSSSIREIMESDGPAVVFLEYDLQRGASFARMEAFLIDQGLKRAMGGRKTDREPAYFILDEFGLLPIPLTHVADGLSFGREQKVRMLMGIQNVSAVREVYGEYGAEKILSGFQNIMMFKTMDSKTRKFFIENIGENYRGYHTSFFQHPVNDQRVGHCVEDWDILALKKGEGIVRLADGQPFLFQFPLYQRNR